jgi:hypothetical protein
MAEMALMYSVGSSPETKRHAQGRQFGASCLVSGNLPLE